MKKLFLLYAFMLTVCGTAMAQTVGDCFASNGLRYKITSLSPNTVEVTTVSDNAAQHYSMTEVNIPVRATYSNEVFTITAIGGGANFTTAAFYNSEIETIKFASGSQIAEIGDYAFYKSTATSITMPASLATIGKSAFAGCAALQTVNLQEGLTTIGQYAFDGCKALQSITIPASVNSIAPYAFGNCTALADVTVSWTDAASIPTPGTNAFSNIATGAVLIVPAGTKELYKAKGWDQWFTINTGGSPEPDECDPITEFPYFNDFEDFTVNHDCWISIDADGDGQDWITGTAQSGGRNGYNSSTGLISKSYNYDALSGGISTDIYADNYLLTPEFVLPANKTVTLSWYVSSHGGPDWPDWYEVMIAPNGSTYINDFVQILNQDGPSDWEQRTIDISRYAGTTVRVVFHHQDYAQYWIKIDNLGITVEGPEYDVMEITANQDPDHKTHYYSTFYSSTKAYSVPEGVTAYTGVVDGNVLKLTSITDGIIPAGEAVILRLTTAEDNTAATKQQIALTATTETGTKSKNNALTGTDVEKTLGANEYALSLGQYGVGFYLWKGKPIGANKAYLTLGSYAGAKAFIFQFDDGTTTGILKPVVDGKKDGSAYNLNGIRVNDNYKGIVIKNGRKIYWRGQSE